MYRKILVPLDGSELAEKALTHAEEVARGSQARLTLIRCPLEADPVALQAALTKGPCHHEEVREMSRKQAHEYLDAVAARLPDLVDEVKTPYGNPAENILDAAAHGKFDLIVISSHGRSGVNRFVFGSVADKVVRHAPCPVLVVGGRA